MSTGQLQIIPMCWAPSPTWSINIPMSLILIVLLYSISVLLFSFVFHFGLLFFCFFSLNLSHSHDSSSFFPFCSYCFHLFLMLINPPMTPIDLLLFLLRLLGFFLILWHLFSSSCIGVQVCYTITTRSLGGGQSIVQRGSDSMGRDVASTYHCAPSIVCWWLSQYFRSKGRRVRGGSEVRRFGRGCRSQRRYQRCLLKMIFRLEKEDYITCLLYYEVRSR